MGATETIVVREDRFYPFGETRFTTGTMNTDKLFTGQREMAGLGIYHYGARFYSPKLGRFLSADSIVPTPFNPQSLNRFSYVRNNPLRYTDPTGHMADDDGGGGVSCTVTHTCPGTGGRTGGGGGNYCSTHPNACIGTRDGSRTGAESDGTGSRDGTGVGSQSSPLPNLNPISNYCGDISGLACLANAAQDVATVTDLVGVGLIETPAVAVGCFEGGPLGCAIAEVGVIATWNLTLNTVELGASTVSLGFTVADDYFNNDRRLGENTATALATWGAGLAPLPPSWDFAVDFYASGYNHGFFNGIDTILDNGLFR